MMKNDGSEIFFAGIDAGSVSVNAVVVDRNRAVVFEAPYVRHLGKVEEIAADLLHTLLERFGPDRLQSVSFTGVHGKRLSEKLGTFYEFETISQVLGTLAVVPDARSIISMGGQLAP